ncbi:MAG: tetratricopeptide repeat protein [Candidatus Delongbacteria bacterium]|nr:tetratricopeptide repeat protein [Candidatus Delongbacteria bacterium]
MRNLVPERILHIIKNNKSSDRFECFSMFVDISGFTKTTEALMRHGQEGAEVLSDILRYLFDTTVRAVYDHGGYVTKYAGDAFTAIFELKTDKGAVAANVMQAALITNNFFEENKIYRSRFGDFEFGVKVGIGFGECVCGIAGSDKEKTYYFSGSAVDLCAMAEHNAVKGQIWASESAFSEMRDKTTQFSEAELYGLKFFRIIKTAVFRSEKQGYVPKVFDKGLIYTMAGKKEAEFPVGEFRDVISVFISFQGNGKLGILMETVYKLKEMYGGSHPVLDFGDKGGNILLFFGAPISYENNAFRALSFMMRLRHSASGFDIRAGLAKGIVYCGFNGSELRNEFTCLGNTVNQSARFMMKAQWGQVLTDRDLAGEKQFWFTDLGGLEYKGREGLIQTYALEGKTEVKEVFFKGSFVGREKELARLRKYLEPLQRGKNCGVIYIDGDAGIGKSRLTNYIRLEYEKKETEQPVKWFYFSCDDIIKEPHNPFKYFFNRYFDLEEDALIQNTEKFDQKFKAILDRTESKKHRSLLESRRDYIAYFLKLRVNDPSVLIEEPNERQNSIILALIEFFRTFTERSSLVFEIDNGSSIDQDSLKLLSRIAVSLKRSPFAVIFNCRYKDNGEAYDHNLTRQKRIKLKNFSKTEFRDLVKDRLKLKTVPKDTLSVLEDKSRLNPLFLEQVAIYITDNSVLDKKNRIKDPSILPVGMNQIILARIDKLKTNLKEIIKTASCIGNEIALDLLSYLFSNKYSDISGFLTDLEKEDIFILFSEMSYLFKYGVIRDVVYNIQLKKVLRELHGEIGEAIEKIHSKNIENYYSVLAYHYENAENAEKALFYHEKAGYQAKDNYHNDQALYHFDRAAYFISVKNGITEDEWVGKYKELDRNEMQRYIEINLRKFHFYFVFNQDIESSSRIIDRIIFLADKVGDESLISNILVEKSLLLANKGDYEESNKNLLKSIGIFKRLGIYNKISLAFNTLGKNHMTIGEINKANDYYDQGLNYAKQIENDSERERIESKLYGDIGVMYDYSGDFEKALDFYGRQLAISEKQNLKIDKASALGNIGVVYHLTGNLSKAREFYEEKLRISEELGRRLDIAQILNNLGFLYKDLNNLKKAIKFHKQSYSISQELNDYNTMASSSINLGHVYKAQEEFKKAEKAYSNGIALSDRYGLKHNLAEGMIELSDLYFRTQNLDSALKYLKRGLATAEEIGFAEYIEKGKSYEAKYSRN